MKKIELTSRKLLRKIFGGISLTAVAFTFQACYGTGPDEHCDMRFTGTVISKTTNLPIQGIKVALNDGIIYGFTDKNGKFDIYAYEMDLNCEDCISGKAKIHFLDVDGADNGHFADLSRDVIYPKCNGEVEMNIELEAMK